LYIFWGSWKFQNYVDGLYLAIFSLILNGHHYLMALAFTCLDACSTLAVRFCKLGVLRIWDVHSGSGFFFSLEGGGAFMILSQETYSPSRRSNNKEEGKE
jgi:hypothetical protein